MTSTIERITSQEQLEYLGMNGDALNRIVIPVKLQNSTISNDQYLISLIKMESYWNQHNSPLDQCLDKLSVSMADDSFTALISDEKPELTVAVLHDTLMMKLFPPRNTCIESSILNLPIFEIEYILSDIPFNINENYIINSLIKARDIFEGEFLFEMLNKAVRSQRNKIEKPFNNSSISEALELIERENYKPSHILANSKAYSLIRNDIDAINNTYRGIPIINFNPSGRMNKNRVYFIGEPEVVGRVVKTDWQISRERKEDKWNISCLLRMGAVILNRDLISVIEH